MDNSYSSKGATYNIINRIFAESTVKPLVSRSWLVEIWLRKFDLSRDVDLTTIFVVAGRRLQVAQPGGPTIGLAVALHIQCVSKMSSFYFLNKSVKN